MRLNELKNTLEKETKIENKKYKEKKLKNKKMTIEKQENELNDIISTIENKSEIEMIGIIFNVISDFPIILFSKNNKFIKNFTRGRNINFESKEFKNSLYNQLRKKVINTIYQIDNEMFLEKVNYLIKINYQDEKNKIKQLFKKEKSIILKESDFQKIKNEIIEIMLTIIKNEIYEIKDKNKIKKLYYNVLNLKTKGEINEENIAYYRAGSISFFAKEKINLNLKEIKEYHKNKFQKSENKEELFEKIIIKNYVDYYYLLNKEQKEKLKKIKEDEFFNKYEIIKEIKFEERKTNLKNNLLLEIRELEKIIKKEDDQCAI